MPLSRHKPALLVGIVLGLATALLYWPVAGYDFIGFDDPTYIVNNNSINQGLSWKGLAWCFQPGYAANWHPLTWMSHMLDCQLYGVKAAGGHHVTNLAFHVANTLLLFALLRRMTKSLWRSAVVAALFAWHPLHVESVAWVSERKDVLSTLFWLLTLWAYCRYVEKRGVARYLWVVMFFVLGLMAKPMVVTLPFVLLLLDWWPLRRLVPDPAPRSAPVPGRSNVRAHKMPANQPGVSSRFSPLLGQFWRLVVEKIPLFLLIIPSSMITIMAQSRGHAVSTLALSDRLGDATVSYCWYLGKLVWPVDLGVLYPFVKSFPASTILGCGLLLAIISVMTVWRWRKGYCLIGWLWFLGTLVPVIGLVQVGTQSWADRYSYIPFIGLFVGVCWAAGECAARFKRGAPVAATLAAMALACCLAAARHQICYWEGSETLFRHTLAVTRHNYMIQTALGSVFDDQKRTDEARALFEEAIRIRPQYYLPHSRLGALLLEQGKIEEAEAQFRDSIARLPDQFEARMNLGDLLMRKNKAAEAEEQYVAAVSANPEQSAGHRMLGQALLAQRRIEEARAQFFESLRLEPQNADTHYLLAAVLGLQKKTAEAVVRYQEALRLQPDHLYALNSLAWVFATSATPETRNGEEAVRLATRACAMTEDKEPSFIATLAAALAQAGRFEEAVPCAQKARDLAASLGRKEVAAKYTELMEVYKSHQAYRETEVAGK